MRFVIRTRGMIFIASRYLPCEVKVVVSVVTPSAVT